MTESAVEICESPLRADLLEVGMHWTPWSGGADRYFHGLMSAFGAAGIPVEALAFDGEELEITRHDKYHSLGSKHLGGMERMRRLRSAARLFNQEAPPGSVIATHFALYALPMFGQLRKHRHIVHFHGSWADEASMEGGRALVVMVKRLIERLVYSTAEKFITLSEAFKTILSERLGVSANRIEVIPGGIDSRAFELSATRAEARIRLGWPQERQIVLCVRRLVSRMGLEQLIEAVIDVRRHVPEALFMIGGEGGLREKLELRIADSGLAGNVKLLGYVPDADLAWAYRAADFSIVPSQSLEGFGLVTLESLAAGTPVLVTPVGGLPEAVTHLNGKLVLSGTSVSDLAEGLSAALDGKLPLPSESECREYVRQNFDWSVIAPRVLDVYHRT